MAQSVVFRYRRIQKGIGFFLALFLVLLPSASFVFSPVAEAERITAVSSSGGASSIVIEASTLRVLSAFDAHTPKPMASTTKILTAITVIKHVDVNRVVAVSPEAVGIEGSSIYLRAGEKWRVIDLLYGLMLRSGNDAAVQLALTTAGSVEAFAAMMNETAYLAGAFHSHFVNPHGLHHPDHYTTAYDLALITAYALRDPLFCQIVSSRSHTYTVGEEKRVFVNKNKMLAGYPGAIGVKTGYTKVAGRCLVTAADRDGMRLISVVLNEYDMWYRSADLLDAAYASYHLTPLWTAGETRTLKVRGDIRPVTVRATAYYPLTERERKRLIWTFSLLGRPTSDALLGEAFATLDGRVLARTNVYAAF